MADQLGMSTWKKREKYEVVEGAVAEEGVVAVWRWKQPQKKVRLNQKMARYCCFPYTCISVFQPLLRGVLPVKIVLAVVKPRLLPCIHTLDLSASHWPRKQDCWLHQLFDSLGPPSASLKYYLRQKLCGQRRISEAHEGKNTEKKGILVHNVVSVAYKLHKVLLC